MDVLQLNEHANLVLINGQQLQPHFLPGREADWSGNWTRISLYVAPHMLLPGRNTLTLEVAPLFTRKGWDELQVRNIVLFAEP